MVIVVVPVIIIVVVVVVVVVVNSISISQNIFIRLKKILSVQFLLLIL